MSCLPSALSKAGLAESAFRRGMQVWIAASTKPGEEELVLKALRNCERQTQPEAGHSPRNPERFVATGTSSSSENSRKRGGHYSQRTRKTILLLDTIGESLRPSSMRPLSSWRNTGTARWSQHPRTGAVQQADRRPAHGKFRESLESLWKPGGPPDSASANLRLQFRKSWTNRLAAELGGKPENHRAESGATERVIRFFNRRGNR